MNNQPYPVAVIGGGPIGLAAAAHLATRGERFIVLEAGAEIAAGVRSWAHVRVFSPWQYNVDQAAVALLEPTGWQMPDGYPTGAELIERYLTPLADLPQIRPSLITGARVTSIARQGMDKMKAIGREAAPFVIRYTNADGDEEEFLARAVIDASGGKVGPLGANGTPAMGERSAQDQITYGIPDILGKDTARYANKRVLVLGSGHSAFNAILDLIILCESARDTEITWAVRRGAVGQMFGGGSDDGLGRRGALGQRAETAVESGRVRFVTGFRAQRVRRTNSGIIVEDNQTELGPFDQIIGATGFRPDLSILSELRLSIHEGTEGVSAIAPLIDPNFHSCGSVPPHGAEELKHPEPDFYIVGMKSYGRAPTFLMLTGYEQVRSVVAALAGDWEAARKVELVLPESGVCSGGEGSTCCTPEPVQVSNMISFDSLLATPVPDAACCGTECCSTDTIAEMPELIPIAVADAACCGSDCCGGSVQQNLLSVDLIASPVSTN